jgi:hypothetical protein
MSDHETMALYLNVATDRLKTDQSLRWLTGVATAFAVTRAPSQETQCMSVGGALWIANNDDADTATQQTFLEAMGINTPPVTRNRSS